MLWAIGFFTVILIIDCLLLILLVLVQLPKKEAGIGQAFGGAATDALFGAGSGNALTKMTKVTAGIFFVLTLAIYIMYNHQARNRAGGFVSRLQQAAREPDGTAAPKAPPGAPLTGTNVPKISTTVPATSNQATRGLLTVPQSALPKATVTNAAPAPSTAAPAPTK